jgi:hypothetical protein
MKQKKGFSLTLEQERFNRKMKKVTGQIPKKEASILEDEFSKTVIKGALKSLKWVSILSLSLKLAAIVAMLESFVDEEEAMIEERKKPEAMPFGYERFGGLKNG